jgi:hypothetical protein
MSIMPGFWPAILSELMARYGALTWTPESTSLRQLYLIRDG